MKQNFLFKDPVLFDRYFNENKNIKIISFSFSLSAHDNANSFHKTEQFSNNVNKNSSKPIYTKGACFRLSLPCLSDGNILGQCFDMKVFESFNLLQLIN